MLVLDRMTHNEIKIVEGLNDGKERGRGCFGAVYEVRVNGLPCIAKRLHDILVGRGGQEPVGREQRGGVIDCFRRECDLHGSLRHPNVVQFMGVHYGRDEPDISLIMEYMHMDLQHCMETYPDIPLPYKTSILRDVAYGLAYLHSIPVLHRDLNAGNVLLTESLRAKIADLGVAKLFDREIALVRTKTLCPGAPDFMPPEALSLPPRYSDKLDVFSFGHLAIYLINQEAPHVQDSTVTEEDLRKKQMQVGKRRTSLNKMGGLRHPLSTTVVYCLCDIPDHRPTSKELARRMEELCKQQPSPHVNTLETLAVLKQQSDELETLNSRVKQTDQVIQELQTKLTMAKELQQQLEIIERDKTAQLLACRNKAENNRKSFQETVDKLMSSIEVLKCQLSDEQQKYRTLEEVVEKQQHDMQKRQKEMTAMQNDLTISYDDKKELSRQIQVFQHQLQQKEEKEDRDQLRLEKAVASINSAVKKSSKSTNAVMKEQTLDQRGTVNQEAKHLSRWSSPGGSSSSSSFVSCSSPTAASNSATVLQSTPPDNSSVSPNASLTAAAITHSSPREERIMSVIQERDTVITSMKKLEEMLMKMKTLLVRSKQISPSPRQFTSPLASQQKYSPVSSRSPKIPDPPAPTPVQSETTTTSGSQPLSFPPFFTSSPGQRSPLNSTTDSVDFTPIVSLPEVFNIQSGEEEEEVLFSHRAKLYRFDESIKQWKERGLGDIKILEHKRTRKCRVLMRRERIFKICCNHTITPYMQLKPFGANNESWLWFTPCDYSDLVAKPEKLVIKFKLVETAQNFQRVFNRCTSGSSQQEEGKEMDNEKEEPVTE